MELIHSSEIKKKLNHFESLFYLIFYFDQAKEGLFRDQSQKSFTISRHIQQAVDGEGKGVLSNDLYQKEPHSQTNTCTVANMDNSPNKLLTNFLQNLHSFRKATLISSQCFCCFSYYKSSKSKPNRFPKKWQNLPFFLKNVCQISAKLIAFQRNFPRKFPQNQSFFTNFFSEVWPEIHLNFL